MNNRNQRPLLIIAILLIGILLGAFFLNTGYGETSEEGYQIAQALYTACNQQDADRVEQIKTMLQESHQSNNIRRNEYRWLSSIVRLAEKNQWKQAVVAARKLMDAQIRYAVSRR